MKIETNDPLATVLIANYNSSKYIDQCLESVINQNYKKIEIVLVDDNSSDNSLEILNNYAGQIKLIKKKKKTLVKGSLGRLIDKLNQYNQIYDIWQMQPREIISLLPNEFKELKELNGY